MRKRNPSIADRLRLTVGIFLLVLFASIVLMLSTYYRNAMLENAGLQVQHEDEILIQTIGNRISTTNSCSNTIILELNNSLSKEHLNGVYPKVDTSTQRVIYQSLLNTFTMFEDAHQASIVWDNGICIYKSREAGNYMYTDQTALYEELASLGISTDGKWINQINSAGMLQGTGQYFAKPYTDIQSGKRLGYVIIKLKSAFNVLEVVGNDRAFHLFDRNGHLIQTTNSDYTNLVYRESSYDQRLDLSVAIRNEIVNTTVDRNHFMTENSFHKGWTLITVADFSSLISTLNTTIFYILAISFLAVVGLFLILNIVISHMVLPIQELSKHMVSTPDRLPLPIHLECRDDEVGLLIEHFNEMACKNIDLMGRVIDEQKNQQRLELALLQSQIKPHFLYNTLDTVYCLNCTKKYDEASRVTKLLSDYYRTILFRGMEWIPLDQEVKSVAKYLEIQTIRYSNVLSYSIEQDDELNQMMIPKLTLQPLVENSIYHGIKPMDCPGKVTICITKKETAAEIRVSDNGVGMPIEIQEAVMQSSSIGENKNAIGFGLRNVFKRLQLFYGSRCHLEFEKVAQGTSILIKIDHVQEE